MTSELRSKILGSKDLPSEIVEVPQWKVKVKVVGMSAGARGLLIEKSMNKKTGELDFTKLYPLLVVDTVYDPDTDEKVFEHDDIEELLKKSGAAMEVIGQAALRLSGFDGEDVEELGKPS